MYKERETMYKEALKKASAKMDELMRKVSELERREPIAVIGMGCRFPGGADNPAAFWEVLQKGIDTVSEIPPQRWDIEKYYDPDVEAPGKMITRQAAFLDDVDKFDASFFGISPIEAGALDPQQRILLEVTHQALEAAGLNIKELRGSRTGVFIGISSHDYTQLLLAGNPEEINPYSITGVTSSTACGRISYFYGFNGPSMAIDTACSSSLVSLHTAVQSLNNRDSDLALAGGVNLLLVPETFIGLSRLTALSPEGRCFTFDNSANGYGRGEGCGVVVLKRLGDAQRDGDTILAIIKGTAVNQDGESNGLTAPNAIAQEKVISEALKKAGISPAAVDYLEAHGTGTKLGDPIEVQALGNVFKQRDNNHKLLIGSVKTNIGHLDGAAGLAGVIKVILALQNNKIPPSLHFRTPNSYIPWEQIPIEVVSKLTSWEKNKKPRIAGVSSFGFSGTNAHAVIEEAPSPSPPGAGKNSQALLEKPAYIINLSAKTDGALKKLAASYIDFLADDTAPPLWDVCYTSMLSRGSYPKRIALVGRSGQDFQKILSDYLNDKPNMNIHIKSRRKIEQCKTAFLFTGLDAQYTGMTENLYKTLPVFKKELLTCDEILKEYLGSSIIEVIQNREFEEKLNQAAFARSALFSIQYALARSWISIGIYPSVVTGHSIGEYAAACTAGVFSLEDALKLVVKRGQLMQQLPADGAMMSLVSMDTSVETILGLIQPFKSTVSIAAVNSPKAVVLSGTKSSLDKIDEALKDRVIIKKFINESYAFHSPAIDSILPEFETFAAKIPFHEPSIPFVSTVTGKIAGPGELTNPGYWADNMRKTVRFYEALKTIKQAGFQVFLEIASTPTLITFGKYSFNNFNALWLASLNETGGDWQQMMHTISEFYVNDFDLDWDKIGELFGGKKVVLPNYPFERDQFKLDFLKHPITKKTGALKDTEADISKGTAAEPGTDTDTDSGADTGTNTDIEALINHQLEIMVSQLKLLGIEQRE